MEVNRNIQNQTPPQPDILVSTPEIEALRRSVEFYSALGEYALHLGGNRWAGIEPDSYAGSRPAGVLRPTELIPDETKPQTAKYHLPATRNRSLLTTGYVMRPTAITPVVNADGEQLHTPQGQPIYQEEIGPEPVGHHRSGQVVEQLRASRQRAHANGHQSTLQAEPSFSPPPHSERDSDVLALSQAHKVADDLAAAELKKKGLENDISWLQEHDYPIDKRIRKTLKHADKTMRKQAKVVHKLNKTSSKTTRSLTRKLNKAEKKERKRLRKLPAPPTTPRVTTPSAGYVEYF